MKINFQKIFTVILVLCSAVVLFNINVSAMSKNEYQVRYFDFVGMLERGEMTYEEFEAEVNALTSEYVDSNTDSDGVIDSVAENVSNTVTTVTTGIGDAISAVGNSVNEWISDIFSDYATTESVPTTDLKGYSTLKIEESIASTGAVMKSCTYFNGYVEVSDRSDGYKFYKTYYDDGTCYRMEYKNGRLLEEKFLTDRPNTATASSATRTIWVYGDVRNSDGTPAETDDTYVDQPTYDFSEATDNELDELLQELSEELKRQNPDLSTMEGLLESIYYRLGKLDSDDDNALLSQVIVAIKSSNGELKTILEEIRNSLTDGKDNTDDENEDLTDELEKHLTVGDFVIDEEAYRNNSEVLKLRLQEKFIFADELKELITYTVNSYSNSSENPQLNLSYNDKTYSMNFSAFDEYIPTIRFIIAAFTYITFAFHTYRKIPSYINGGDNE